MVSGPGVVVVGGGASVLKYILKPWKSPMSSVKKVTRNLKIVNTIFYWISKTTYTFTSVSSRHAPLLVSWMTDRIRRDHLVPAAGVGIGPAQFLQDTGVGVGATVDC